MGVTPVLWFTQSLYEENISIILHGNIYKILTIRLHALNL
jgi:hypothetical protein